jgi:hypothetical protein
MYAATNTTRTRRQHQPVDLSIETIAAGILAVLLAVPSPISVNLSLGGLLALALAPVTFPALWRDARGRWLMIATIALVPMGWLVAQTSLLQDNGRTFNNQTFLYHAALPAGLLASLVGAYWCTTKLGLQRFLLLSFAGLLTAALSGYDLQNPWKYGLALPISILAVLLIARNRLLLGLVVMPILAAVSVATDFRSWTAILALATILVVVARSGWTAPSTSKVATRGLAVLVVGLFTGSMLVQAATAGLLGDFMAQRTSKQIEVAGGNLILGGRPEWGAAAALWRENPLGIGVGVTPSSDDYRRAIGAMPLASRGSQETSVVARSFQKGQLNLHSTSLTFWGVYGVAGLVFAALAVIYFGRAILMTMAFAFWQPNLRAAVLLLMLSSLWDMLFSPTVAAQLVVALATAVHILGNRNITPDLRKDAKHESSPAHQRYNNHTQ